MKRAGWMQRTMEDLGGSSLKAATGFLGELAAFAGDDRIVNVRQLGTIAALEIKARDAGYLAGIGPKLYAFFLERGVLLRPLGNTIYVMPPYCASAADLDLAYAAIRDAADLLG